MSATRREAIAAGAVLLAGLGGVPTGLRAQTRTEARAVAGIRAVSWKAAGELFIEQTEREQLGVEAEPALLARILTEVRDGRLEIRFAPGRVETRQPIRVRVALKTLDTLEAQGSGALRIGPLAAPTLTLRLAGSETLHLARLAARTLDVRLDGSGSLDIDGGQVERQQIVIAGAADYLAPRLASREAVVAIEGAGTVHLAVAERLRATIDGSGEVHYLGQPRVTQAVGGSGSVRRVG
jgi:hypothetical protein